LAARILVEEHRLYPEVIRWIAEGRVAVEGRKVTVAR
jgi:phosphoribosylglycinamide formyltransferase-1